MKSLLFLKLLLEQIIQNLIDNAIKYNENKPEIQIEVTKSNQYYMISIEDNGVGISQKHLPKIFERFYKVDASRTKIKGGIRARFKYCKCIRKRI